MKLWLISQSENNNWDTFDSAVVAAETEEDARNTYPSHYDGDEGAFWNGRKWLRTLEDGRIVDQWDSSWTTPNNVRVVFLSDGYHGKAGTICSSFNAG